MKEKQEKKGEKEREIFFEINFPGMRAEYIQKAMVTPD